MEMMIKQDGKNVENMVLQHVKKTDEKGILEDMMIQGSTKKNDTTGCFRI